MQNKKTIYRSDVELAKREFPEAYDRLMQNVEQGKVIILEDLWKTCHYSRIAQVVIPVWKLSVYGRKTTAYESGWGNRLQIMICSAA